MLMLSKCNEYVETVEHKYRLFEEWRNIMTSPPDRIVRESWLGDVRDFRKALVTCSDLQSKELISWKTHYQKSPIS